MDRSSEILLAEDKEKIYTFEIKQTSNCLSLSFDSEPREYEWNFLKEGTDGESLSERIFNISLRFFFLGGQKSEAKPKVDWNNLVDSVFR